MPHFAENLAKALTKAIFRFIIRKKSREYGDEDSKKKQNAKASRDGESRCGVVFSEHHFRVATLKRKGVSDDGSRRNRGGV